MSVDHYHNKKIVAWGASKLLEFYLKNSNEKKIEYVIDSNESRHGGYFNGLPIKGPLSIGEEQSDDVLVVIFAVSNFAVQNILASLNCFGFLLHKNVILYSDLFYDDFSSKVKDTLGLEVNKKNYNLAKSFYLSTKFPVHTTILGNLLLLEMLKKSMSLGEELYPIVEVGAFNCGNALLVSHFLTQYRDIPFYIFDSFEGFPELSKFDPRDKKVGDYNIESTYEYILDNFSFFENTKIIKGFVPYTFDQLESDEKYSIVFYDCDLYQPALDTLNYFWDKLIPGGYFVMHDYVFEEGGFEGVKKAVDEFFAGIDVPVFSFWENTMGVIIKPK